MGSNLSKFRKHIISGDEYAAIQLYTHNSDLHKGLDPNISYGDSYDHNTPMHYVAKHAMKSLLRIFLAELGGNPNKKNGRNESVLHALCCVEGKLTMVQQRKRVECLSLILQWCGPTLQDGRAEKADLNAVDEKENTALHYAAYSGIQKLVEMLVANGSPLFVENQLKDTPCDCAEKMGHDAIALFLESKMVFSDEDQKPEESDLMNSYDLDEGYSGLRAQDLQEAKDQLLVETSDMLHVPLFTAEALLRNHEWSREMLLEAWIKDPVACCEKCGVTPPLALFSEWPGVEGSPGRCDSNDVELKSPTLAAPMLSFERVCGICTCTILYLEEPVPMPCGHQFCRRCWGMYLDGKIAAGEAHSITCAGYMCNKLVPVDIIETLVSRDMASRYLQFDIKAFVESNPSIKWCPHPGCGRAVRLPEAQKIVSPGHRGSGFVSSPSETSHAVDCGNGHTFCWECLGEAHEPASCENWKNWYSKIAEIKPEELTGTDEKTENSANCLWLVTNSKPCPNCKSPIQKNEGCNHMKCSKCKHDFCWVCLEPWKKHSTATGGYFRCNRYEIVKKVDEQQEVMKAEAEAKNKRMQELNKFVHYYSRFKNHENSYKLEEPLFDIAREKMMVLARAATPKESDISVGTKFIQDAVVQLLKARHVLKCSYVFGYYLEDTGYKKPIFEFMQTELEECTESLSEMVARPFLRTPRNKIVQTAILVQRKRHEFVSAIGKGLVPPDTSPERERHKTFNYKMIDEETRKALMASLEDDPTNVLWVKDPSGRHANVSALFDWPEESDESDSEIPSPSKFPSALSSLVSSITFHKSNNRVEPAHPHEGEGRNPSSSSSAGAAGMGASSDVLAGKCAREDCNQLQARNPRTGELHQHCSIKCLRIDQLHKRQGGHQPQGENVVDFNMDLLRALEMSRLQYLRETGSSVDEDEETRPRPVKETSSSSARASQHHMNPDSSSDISQLNLREEEKQMSVAIELSMEEYTRLRKQSNSEDETRSSRCELKSKSCETLSSTAFADTESDAFNEEVPTFCQDSGRLRIHSDQEPQPFTSEGRWKRTIPPRQVELKGPSYTIHSKYKGHHMEGFFTSKRPSRKCFVESMPSPSSQAYLVRPEGAPTYPETKYFGLVKDIDVANISAPQDCDKTFCFKNKDFKKLFFEDCQSRRPHNFQETQVHYTMGCRKTRSSSNGPTDRKKMLQTSFVSNGKRPAHLHGFCFKSKDPQLTHEVLASSQLAASSSAEPPSLHKHKSRMSTHYHPRQHHHHHHKNLCGQNKCNFTKDETVVTVLDVWHHIPHSYGFYAHKEKSGISVGEASDHEPSLPKEHVTTDEYNREEQQKSPRRKSASAFADNQRQKTYLSRGRSENSHLLLPWSSEDRKLDSNDADNIDPVDMVISPRILESLLQGAEGYTNPSSFSSPSNALKGSRFPADSVGQASSSTSNLLASTASVGRLKPAMFSFPDMTTIGDNNNNHNSYCGGDGSGRNGTSDQTRRCVDDSGTTTDYQAVGVQFFLTPSSSSSSSSRYVIRSFQSANSRGKDVVPDKTPATEFSHVTRELSDNRETTMIEENGNNSSNNNNYDSIVYADVAVGEGIAVEAAAFAVAADDDDKRNDDDEDGKKREANVSTADEDVVFI